MKTSVFYIILTVVLSCVSFGVLLDDEVTPGNLESQAYKFTLVPHDKGGLVSFTIVIETKKHREMPTGTSGQVVIKSGNTIVAEIPVEMTRKENKIEVREFFIASEYLAQSSFNFGVSPGLTPSGAVFKFNLKNFVGR